LAKGRPSLTVASAVMPRSTPAAAWFSRMGTRYSTFTLETDEPLFDDISFELIADLSFQKYGFGPTRAEYQAAWRLVTCALDWRDAGDETAAAGRQ
jgi:hypothetical protein